MDQCYTNEGNNDLIVFFQIQWIFFSERKKLQVCCSTMCSEDDANYYQMNDCMCVNYGFGNRNLMFLVLHCTMMYKLKVKGFEHNGPCGTFHIYFSD